MPANHNHDVSIIRPQKGKTKAFLVAARAAGWRAQPVDGQVFVHHPSGAAAQVATAATQHGLQLERTEPCHWTNNSRYDEDAADAAAADAALQDAAENGTLSWDELKAELESK